MDAAAEIDKLVKKSALAESSKDKLQKQMSQPTYASARDEVKTSNAERVSVPTMYNARLIPAAGQA